MDAVTGVVGTRMVEAGTVEAGTYGRTGRSLRRKVALAAGLSLSVGLSGCISVKAPEKPIVIELNINIKQEVVYRLAGDAAQTIDKNAEIF